MLTFPTIELVRDHVAEAYNSRHNRKPGALGIILDPVVIKEYVHSTFTEHECDADRPAACRSIRTEEMLLLRSPIGELAIIGHEGVGDEIDEGKGTVPAYIAIGWSYERVDLPHDVIQRAMRPEQADVADFVRLFGDRLDNNAYIWRRFVGA